MKVESGNNSVELNAYLKQVQRQPKTNDPETQTTAKQAQDGDKVNLSDQAREAMKATQAAKESPDVDAKKVEQAKLDVEKGTYKVVGQQVATDMMRESFENNLILQKVNTRV